MTRQTFQARGHRYFAVLAKQELEAAGREEVTPSRAFSNACPPKGSGNAGTPL